MKDPRHLSIQDYTYPLPDSRIAHYPLPARDASKLLVYKEDHITEDIYRNITDHIPTGSLLVFNNTKVIEARLLFQKPTGGVIEIFCLEPHERYPDITTAMVQREKVWWNCLVGGASKWKAGQVLEKRTGDTSLFARYIEKATGRFVIELSWSPSTQTFAEILHQTGAIPLPPYIKRQAEDTDKTRYQTVYAGNEGSVAAPTAGLHFTEKIFEDLFEKNIKTDFVTLHVGAGTFQPVKSETMEDHEMHAEWIDVSKSTIENILNNWDNTIAVGTTSLRTIESFYWIGVKISSDNFDLSTGLSQWEVYELSKKNMPVKSALQSLLHWMDQHQQDRLITKTQILIAPGYEFKIIKGLVTNFHQPKSTLLLLVAALIGDDLSTGQAGWRKVYTYALAHEFRFLSYGDGCLLWKK